MIRTLNPMHPTRRGPRTARTACAPLSATDAPPTSATSQAPKPRINEVGVMDGQQPEPSDTMLSGDDILSLVGGS